jgi:hypothetical protein
MSVLQRRSVPRAGSDDIDGAIARGVAFLAGEQRPDGGVPGFYRDPGSDPFPCTDIFPATMLAHALESVPEAAGVRAKAAGFLAAEMGAGGLWNFYPREASQRRWFPDDIDDTVCATAALRAAGLAVPPNERLIFANRNGQGLFYTWFADAQRRPRPAISRFVGDCMLRVRQLLGRPVIFSADWVFRNTVASPYDIDAAVNANVLFHFGLREETQPVISYLLSVLRSGTEVGCDKWYRNPFLVLYFIARALAPHSPEGLALVRERLAARTAGTPLERAAALCAAAHCGLGLDTDLVRALLEAQASTGSWPAEPIYWGGDRAWGADAVTTALAIEALALCRHPHLADRAT